MASKKQKTAPLQNWPAEKIEQRPIGELLAYPQNPMIHSDEQVQKIANSITEYGWTTPVLVDESGVLICGHARVRAAQLLGIVEVPVMVARGWTDAQKKAYRIADNQLPRLSVFDDELLRIELNDLKLVDYPLELTGFDDIQLVSFMSGIPGAADAPRGDATKLSERFGVPPFSVLNAREGWWQERKRAWIALGIQSELGRGDTGVNSPHEGHGMADGLVAVRAKQKARRKADAIPGGAGANAAWRRGGAKPNATPGGRNASGR